MSKTNNKFRIIDASTNPNVDSSIWLNCGVESLIIDSERGGIYRGNGSSLPTLISSKLHNNVLTVDTNNVLNKSNLIIGGVEIKNGVTQYILTADNLYTYEDDIDINNVVAQFTGNYVNEIDSEGNESGRQYMEFEVTNADNNYNDLTTLYVYIFDSNWDENNQISGDSLDIKIEPSQEWASCDGSNIVLEKTFVETLNTETICDILINGEKVATKSEIPSMTNVLKVENDGLLNRDSLKIRTHKAGDEIDGVNYIDGDNDTFFNVKDGLFNVEVQNNNDGYQDTKIYSDGTNIKLESYFDTIYSGIEIASNGITMYQNVEGEEFSFSLKNEDIRINGGDVYIDGTVNAIAYYETSDERLKTFGNDINVDFDKLAKVHKSFFTFNSNPNKQELGVSAQEIKEIYPEIVSENNNGYLAVDYSKLSVIALKAIDELHIKNKELEARLNEIEKLLKNI